MSCYSSQVRVGAPRKTKTVDETPNVQGSGGEKEEEEEEEETEKEVTANAPRKRSTRREN